MSEIAERLEKALSTDELTRVRDWCASRHAEKPWYAESGDSPKALVKCDFMVLLIGEVLEARSKQSQEMEK
jgi:hypothetical protein